MDNKDKLSRRIAALLAKAEDPAATQEEAAAFMAKAEELMLKHSIKRAQLEQHTPGKKEPIVSIRIAYTGPAYYWKSLGDIGAGALVEAIGLTGIAVNNRYRLVWLYGTERDCEYVATLLRSVWRQAPRHQRIWARLDAGMNYMVSSGFYTAKEIHHARHNFLMGFCDAVARRVKAARDEVTRSTTGAELVLVARKAEIAEAMSGIGPARSHGINYDSAARRAGFEAGQTADLGNTITK